MEFFGTLNYFIIMFMQISVFCFFGNEVLVTVSKMFILLGFEQIKNISLL